MEIKVSSCNAHVEVEDDNNEQGRIVKDNFEIEVTEFSFGWMNLIFNFNGIKIPFTASYIGPEPLGSLIKAVKGLEESCDGDKESRYFLSWDREPAWSEIEIVRNLETDKLKIAINLNADLMEDKESAKIWTIEDLEFSLFKEGVLKCACSMLQKYGLLGYSMTWDASEGYKFPFDDLLKVLGVEANFDNKTNSYRSDFINDFKTIANNFKN